MSEEISQLPKVICVVIGGKKYPLKEYSLRMKRKIEAKWNSEEAWFALITKKDSETVLNTLLLMFAGESPFKDIDELADALPGNTIALDQVTAAIWQNYLASSPELADAMGEAAKKKREEIMAEMIAKLKA